MKCPPANDQSGFIVFPSSRSNIAERKASYEELNPETKNEAFHGNQHTSGLRQIGEDQPADRFSADTARATGLSKRTVQRDAEQGERSHTSSAS